MTRMFELVELLNKYAYQYYVLDNTTIDDKQYDMLYDELLALEKETGIVLDNSPSKRVGGEVLKAFDTYQHKNKLFSLDKVNTIEELNSFFNKLEAQLSARPSLTLEHKFDGLTLSLTYDNGYLIRATTRGDGVVGEDVTGQIKTIRSIPLSIQYKQYIEIVGEGVMRWSSFLAYNQDAKEPLKNPRNAVAGAIRNLNPKITASRKLDFFAYNINYSEKVFLSQVEVHQFLIENGFTVDTSFRVIDNIEEAKIALAEIEENRANLDYLIDGAVFKLNDIDSRSIVGVTEKFPKWAIAYKFPAEEATTVLNDVVWQVSRTAKLNPLALLEPVDLMGVTVKRATLNNYLDIQKKGICIGDSVFIRRSNDVIPEIMGVAEASRTRLPIPKPIVCPSCNSPIREEKAFLYCTNPDCAPKIIAQIDHFASKPCMDIEGLSEKTAEQLYNDLGIKEVFQLYSMTAESLIKLEGFKDKKISNLLASLENSKNTTLERFLFAIGIPNIGKKSARQLAEKFGSLQAIIEASKEEIISIQDFGEIMGDSVVEFFSNKSNLNLIERLIESGIVFSKREQKTGTFSGKTVVLTGTLNAYKRGKASEMIIERGGTVADNVSKIVNLVVAGQDAGSKLDKARKLNIQIISESEFVEMLNKKEE